MCATSDAKIGEVSIDIFIGYCSGTISIGDFEYDADGTGATREELVERLMKFRKAELATMIADLIDNADEGPLNAP